MLFRSGIGARIRVDVTTPDGPRSIYRTVSSGGSFGATTLRQDIGLGNAEAIESVEIRWPTTGETDRLGPLELDAKRLTCSWNAEPVDLTLTEFWMVYALVRRAGHVKSRDQLMQESHLVVDENTVTSHIKRIRKKFQALDPDFDSIDTVYGMGYRWQAA